VHSAVPIAAVVGCPIRVKLKSNLVQISRNIEKKRGPFFGVQLRTATAEHMHKVSFGKTNQKAVVELKSCS
jgi:hypothetical protein